jgi:hypothetical protein
MVRERIMREKTTADKIALEKSIELLKDYILNEMSAEEFIDAYCFIQNKDDPKTPIIRFEMWPKQRQALRDIEANRHTIILKARQIGLTWLVICYIVHCVLKYPGFDAFVLSETEDKADELILRADTVLRHLPSWLIVDHNTFKQFEKMKKGSYRGLYYTRNTSEIEIVRTGGERSRIKSQPATEGSARSFTGDVFVFDEWAFHRFAEETWVAAEPTVARVNSGRFIGLSTNKRGSLFESLWRNNTIFHRIFLDCFSDPRRTFAWYDEQKQLLGSKIQQEFPRTEEEALLAGENVSFPEWSAELHVCEPFAVPAHWRRFASVDNGYNDPFAWYKFAVSDDGIVYIYYELSRWRDEPQVGYSDQAAMFEADLYVVDADGNEVREKMEYIVVGRDAFNTHHRDKTGKTLIDYYRAGGLKREGFIPATVDRKLRKATFHEYLKPLFDENTGKRYAKLQVFSTCRYLIASMPQLVNDEHNPEVVANLSDIDNCYDGAGYGLISRHAPTSKKKESKSKSWIREDKERLSKPRRRGRRRNETDFGR